MNSIALALASFAAYRVTQRHGLPRLNAVSIFLATWVPISLLCALLDIEPKIVQATWNIIWLAFLGLAGGTIGGSFSSGPAGFLVASFPAATVRTRFLLKWHVVATLFLFAFAVMQLIRSLPLVNAVGGWSAVLSTAGGDLRRASLASSAEQAQTAIDTSGAFSGILNYGLFLGHVSVFTGAVLWRTGRNRTVAVLPIVISAVYGVFSLQRTSFAMALLLFVITAKLLPQLVDPTVSKAYASSPRKRASIFLTVLLGAVGSVVVLLPLTLRNIGTRNSTGMMSLLQYFMSGVLGLNARNLSNPNWLPPPSLTSVGPGPQPGLGSYTFGNLFGVLSRLGFPVPNAPSFYDFYFVQLAGERFPTNTATSIVDFRYDFGLIGVPIAFAFLGLIGTYLQVQVIHGRVSALPFCAFTLVTVVWSFYGSTLLNDIRYALVCLIASMLMSKLADFAPSYSVAGRSM